MKILILADFLPFNFDLENLLLKEKPDAVFTLGDLKENQIEALGDYNKPKFGVYGNHCIEGYLDFLNIKNSHLKLNNFENFSIFGVQGAIGDKDNKFIYSQKESLKLLSKAPKADILISHCPPLGINDEEHSNSHRGSEGILNYIKKYEPLLVFHGHTYPEKDQEISFYNNTIIIYTHGYRILNIEDLEIEKLPKAKSYTPIRDKGFFDDF